MKVTMDDRKVAILEKVAGQPLLKLDAVHLHQLASKQSSWELFCRSGFDKRCDLLRLW